MKTLKNEKGLDLKPCLNCGGSGFSPFGNIRMDDTLVCPCSNFSGEIQWEEGKITIFACENRKMHQPPKIKAKGVKKATMRRSKRKAI